MKDQKRNLNPHKPARAAMWLWSSAYARHGGGSMEFWDSLVRSQKSMARELVSDIEKCRPESAAEKAVSDQSKETRE